MQDPRNTSAGISSVTLILHETPQVRGREAGYQPLPPSPEIATADPFGPLGRDGSPADWLRCLCLEPAPHAHTPGRQDFITAPKPALQPDKITGSEVNYGP